MAEHAPGLRPKTQEQLDKQLDTVQHLHLGTEDKLSLVPRSPVRAEILNMPEEDLEKQFKRRYDIYQKLLHHQTDDIGQMRRWLVALNSLDSYVAGHVSGEMEPTLKDRQLTVFEDLRKFIEAGGKDGYVKLPTGFGKTVLFTEMLEAMQLKTLVVVPTKVLVGQTAKKLDKFAADTEYGQLHGTLKQYGRQVTIVTYDSLRIGVNNGTINPDDYECLMLDEVHKGLGDETVKVLNKFTKALRLGFTATPDYYADKSVSDLLPNEIHRMDVREGVEEGLMSSFSAIVAKTKDVDLSKIKITASGEYNEAELAKAVNIKARNQSAVDLYKQAFMGQAAIAYCVGVEHAKNLTELFVANDVKAEVISGKTSDEERERILQDYQDGKIQVLCNADLLIEGFDEPRASVCLNLRPTRSRVVAEQRGGRVLRLDPDRPDKFAYVVDFLDQGYDPEDMPILFADIVDGTTILRKRSSGGKSTGGELPTPPPVSLPDIKIDGLEVTVDSKEIMRIVNEHRDASAKIEHKKREKNFLDFKSLQIEVRKLVIRNKREYRIAQQTRPLWPSSPESLPAYFGQWPSGSWDEFLGKKFFDSELEPKFLSFVDLRKEVRAANLANKREYREEQKKHSNWYSSPETYKAYATEWPSGGWPEFLGTEKARTTQSTDVEPKIEKARPGWMTTADIASAIGYKTPNPIDRYIEKRDWGDRGIVMISPKNKNMRYYPPELSNFIITALRAYWEKRELSV